MDLIKFNEALLNYLKKEYGEQEHISEEDGVYDLAFTTDEDETENYELKFDSNSMEMIWLIDEKEIHKEIYTEEEILDLLENGSAFDLLGEYCYEGRDPDNDEDEYYDYED
ncbi:MAG: hypothetical protein ACRC92_14095 [Peptostreptococcaceae bacterium]